MFSWMFLIIFFFVEKIQLVAQLDGSWGEKARKVRVEEQLVLMLAKDTNRNSNAVSPHFHCMRKTSCFGF